MKKNILTSKELALQTIDSFLSSEHRLISYSLKDHIIFVLGGPEQCLHFHDTREAVKGILAKAEAHKGELYYDRAIDLLNNLLMLCDSLIEDRFVEAELTRWVIETDDSKTISKHLSEDLLKNLTIQYELLSNLEALKREEWKIRCRNDEKRKTR